MTSLQEIAIALSDKIWDLAEVKFDTLKSCDLYVEILQNYGFEVTRPYLNLEHGFKAVWGTGKPTIGFLAEYDALEGMSQQAGVYHPLADEAMETSHACGHNILGSAVLLAVLDLQMELKKSNKEATLILYGCPAEESGYGKSILANQSAFDGVDMALTWHPHYINALWQDRTLAVSSIIFNFKGQASHAAFAPELGRSALDACEIMNIGTNYLREHISDATRIHYAYLNAGGRAPNVVQEEATLIYFLRAFEQDILDDLVQRVCDIAKGAALISGTTLDIKKDATCQSLLPNETLANVVYKHLKPTPYSKQALDEVKNFNENVSNFNILQPYTIDNYSYASTDVGDVSQVVPTCQFFLACEPNKAPLHSWQWAANGKSKLAHEGIIKAAAVLFNTALECINDPEIIEAAHQEFKMRKE